MKKLFMSVKQKIDLKNYDWRRYNFSLILLVIILSCISAFVLSLSGDSSFVKQIIGRSEERRVGKEC